MVPIECRSKKRQALQPTLLRIRTDETVFPMFYAIVHRPIIVDPRNLDRREVEEFDIRLERMVPILLEGHRRNIDPALGKPIKKSRPVIDKIVNDVDAAGISVL